MALHTFDLKADWTDLRNDIETIETKNLQTQV